MSGDADPQSIRASLRRLRRLAEWYRARLEDVNARIAAIEAGARYRGSDASASDQTAGKPSSRINGPLAGRIDAMFFYRLHSLHPDESFTAADFECASDDVALEAISAIEPEDTMKLWQGARLVSRIEP